MGAGKGRNRRAQSRVLSAQGLAKGTTSLDSLAAVQALHLDVDIEASENVDGIALSMLRVPPGERRAGKASAALKSLLEYADQKNKPVALTPEPLMSLAEHAGPQRQLAEKGLSRSALVAWYAAYGFVPNKGRYKDFAFRESYIRPAQISS
jgi:hypothetical protein